MTREEQIAIASCAYGSRGSSIDFTVGAKWADSHPKSPWISIEDDLPCNHPELIRKMGHATSQVLTLEGDHEIYLNKMIKFGQEWKWVDSKKPHFWAIIHELPI